MTGICLAWLVAASVCEPQPNDQKLRHQVEEAVAILTSELLDNVTLTLDIEDYILQDGTRSSSVKSRATFARVGRVAFADIHSAEKLVAKPGQPASERHYFDQYYLNPNFPCMIGCDYTITPKGKVPKRIVVEPSRGYDLSLFLLTSNVGLDFLLSKYVGPWDENLLSISKLKPESVNAENGEVVASYRSKYGLTAVTVSTISGRFLPTRIQVLQSPDDVFSYLAKGETLRMWDESALGKHPEGLEKRSFETAVAYSVEKGLPQLQALTTTEEMSADKRHFVAVKKVVVSNYTKCDSLAAIEEMRVKIPEGFRVSTGNEEYAKLQLAWKNADGLPALDKPNADAGANNNSKAEAGQVVRLVDGPAIGQAGPAHFSPLPTSSRQWFVAIGLAATAGALLIGAGLRWWYTKRAA